MKKFILLAALLSTGCLLDEPVATVPTTPLEIVLPSAPTEKVELLIPVGYFDAGVESDFSSDAPPYIRCAQDFEDICGTMLVLVNENLMPEMHYIYLCLGPGRDRFVCPE